MWRDGKVNAIENDLNDYFCNQCGHKMLDKKLGHDECIKQTDKDLKNLKVLSKDIKSRLTLVNSLELKSLKILIDLKIRELEKYKRLQ